MPSSFRRLTPTPLLSFYHRVLAALGALWHHFPSRRMLVIGVTGTRGKTTAANFLWSIFTAAGFKTGLTGTANIRIGQEERMNPYHMTMPGRFALQELLAEMRTAGCVVVIVETPSEGIEQHRQRGIAYDAMVLTALYPEYLAVHRWNFERCKAMMEVPFRELSRQPKKKLRGKPAPKVIAVNVDHEDVQRFLRHMADVRVLYGLSPAASVRATDVAALPGGVAFRVGGELFRLQLTGTFNVENALAAISVARAYKIPAAAIQDGLQRLTGVPGRMERVDQSQPFTVFVDYAHDGPSIEAALRAAREVAFSSRGKVTVLLGAEGGGRDKKKRPVMGRLVAQLADQVVVSDVDPYEDDPKEILEDIARAAESHGKIRGSDLHVIEDRRAGIRKALQLAGKGDVVLVTGKGAEQSFEKGGRRYPWDDRQVVREELKSLSLVVCRL